MAICQGGPFGGKRGPKGASICTGHVNSNSTRPDLSSSPIPRGQCSVQWRLQITVPRRRLQGWVRRRAEVEVFPVHPLSRPKVWRPRLESTSFDACWKGKSWWVAFGRLVESLRVMGGNIVILGSYLPQNIANHVDLEVKRASACNEYALPGVIAGRRVNGAPMKTSFASVEPVVEIVGSRNWLNVAVPQDQRQLYHTRHGSLWRACLHVGCVVGPQWRPIAVQSFPMHEVYGRNAFYDRASESVELFKDLRSDDLL
ncbi:hypothetical protein L210DRAFT_3631211 [Boletus edulis BED1]|uniref:Uncharacterized protein n=1 Tax=Boletus edulis BED1 TaxID=1328754 RepID=A0AAD4GEG8_BOLED|nr:hypothetical protein L210DRAFT_3631211 [Boletus edulis BED1]